MKPLRILWCALLLLFAFLPAAFAVGETIPAFAWRVPYGKEWTPQLRI